jgi:hypothetical protein
MAVHPENEFNVFCESHVLSSSAKAYSGPAISLKVHFHNKSFSLFKHYPEYAD